MASPLIFKLTCLVLLSMVVCSPLAESAMTCGQVASTVAPCIPYVRSMGGPVPAPCCNGLRALNNAAKTTPDRQAVCRCIKSIAATMSGLNLPLLAGLPGKCGVNLPYKISPSIDCNSVK